MLKLGRCIKVVEDVELPSGKVVHINCNVSAKLADLIRTYADAAYYADKVKQQSNENDRMEFYSKFCLFLGQVFGKSWTEIYTEYDGDACEITEVLSDWAFSVVMPKIKEASEHKLSERKREGLFK